MRPRALIPALAILLVLTPLDTAAQERWRELGLISLFVQWAALSSAAVLCVTRRYLNRLSDVGAASISYLIMLAVLGLVSEVGYRLMNFIGPAHDPAWHLHFLARNLAMGAIINALVLRYFYVQHQWTRNIRAEAQARLQALQSRIRPHFLFNSMNTIASLTRTRPDQAETAVENLADLFRISLSDARNRVTLGEELELCRRYLYIEALRLGERLAVEWEVATLPMDALIPPLTLQPLLENAIYYGIEPRTDGGVIHIDGRRDGERLQIDISNPAATGAARRNGNRLALENVRERLGVYYGADAAVELEQQDQRFVVRVQLPYQRGDEHEGANRG